MTANGDEKKQDDLLWECQEYYSDVNPRITWWNQSGASEVAFYIVAPFVLALYGVIALIVLALFGTIEVGRAIARTLSR